VPLGPDHSPTRLEVMTTTSHRLRPDRIDRQPQTPDRPIERRVPHSTDTFTTPENLFQ
jgi:hypothetical protein